MAFRNRHLAGGGIPIGGIILWPVPSPVVPAAPNDWKECDGSIFQNVEYPQAAPLLGTTWGSAPAGFTRLPNFRSRLLLGKDFTIGSPGETLADTGGAVDHAHAPHQLTLAQMPTHSHDHAHVTATEPSHQHDIIRKTGTGGSTGFARGSATADGTFPASSAGMHFHTTNADGQQAGADQAHNHGTGANMPPFIVVRFMIRLR